VKIKGYDDWKKYINFGGIMDSTNELKENIVIEEHPEIKQTWMKIGDRIVCVAYGNKEKLKSLLQADLE
jgi:hypothetical protein